MTDNFKPQSWRDVFDSNKYLCAGQHIDDMIEFLPETGYSFFAFNGMIYNAKGERVKIYRDMVVGDLL